MSNLPEVITVGPEEEATRLWEGALRAHDQAADSLVALCEALDLGVRAAEILAIQGLQPVREKFPATIALQLETPAADVEPFRDAITAPKAMQFTDIVDLLSAAELECVSPKLHRGWEDRRFSCRRSRETAQQAIGVTLEEGQRNDLLLLSAYRNRIFRYPPPLRIVPAEILEAFRALLDLVPRLEG